MKNFQSVIKKILGAVIVIAIAFICIKVVVVSLDKSEISSCLKLQQQAEEIQGFFLIQWQDQMCKAHNIVINAPVR